MKRSIDLVVKNFLTDLQPVTDWLQSTEPGQQTAYWLDQELAGHQAGDRLAARAPQLVEAVAVGARRYLKWVDPTRLDETNPWVPRPDPIGSEAAVRDAARRLAINDLSELTSTDWTERRLDATSLKKITDARAAVQAACDIEEIEHYVRRVEREGAPLINLDGPVAATDGPAASQSGAQRSARGTADIGLA